MVVIRLAALDSRVVTALVVGGMLLVFGLLLVITAAGELRGRRKAKVPSAMRPAPSDEELERSVLPRYLAWGFLATALMAVWLPIYWLREPTRLTEKRALFEQLAVTHEEEGGEKIYDDFCLQCHGDGGVGLTNKITVDGVDTLYAEPPLRFIYSRYDAGGLSEDQITQLVYDAINRGRPNTPMPTWGSAFGGPFNSHQVDNVVAYIQSIQESFPEAEEDGGEAIFAANCQVCHGVGGSGRSKEGGLTVGPNLTVALDRLTIEQLRETIEHGRLNTNRPSMPTWAALGEDAIDALVRFIQSIQRSA
jgi:mono/diheme cytochrome c family protein